MRRYVGVLLQLIVFFLFLPWVYESRLMGMLAWIAMLGIFAGWCAFILSPRGSKWVRAGETRDQSREKE